MRVRPGQSAPTASELPFRVHFADETKFDVTAADAKAAREIAEERHGARATKVKLVRDDHA